MHEYSIVQALLARVDDEARARRASTVHRVSVRVGELAGIEVELLTTAFRMFRERTLCDRADLDVHVVPALWACPGCGREIALGGVLTCPACRTPARLGHGDEIMLERIELEVP